MADFTPGPWVGVDTKLEIVICPAGRDGDIAIMQGTREEQSANGYLVAAAPDLYEMTELFARSIEHQIRRDEAAGDDEGARLKTATLNHVRAALAKAEGPRPRETLLEKGD